VRQQNPILTFPFENLKIRVSTKKVKLLPIPLEETSIEEIHEERLVDMIDDQKS